MNRLDLIDYRNSTPYIKQLEEDLQIRLDRLTRITPTYSENFGGKQNLDKLAEGVADLIEHENKLLEVIMIRNESRKKVAKAVDDMPNDKYQKVILYSKYIAEQPKTLSQIAEMLPRNYDYKYVCKLHGNALDEFDRRYENE